MLYTVVALGFTSIDPVKALYWSAVINGVISAPIMVVAMLMAANTTVMGRFVIKGKVKILGWLANGIMAVSVLIMLYTLLASL